MLVYRDQSADWIYLDLHLCSVSRVYLATLPMNIPMDMPVDMIFVTSKGQSYLYLTLIFGPSSSLMNPTPAGICSKVNIINAQVL